MRTLATHPVDYLVVPRLAACHIALPLLTVESIAMGIRAGYLVGVHLLGIDPAYAWHNLVRYTGVVDVCNGLIKALIFGGIVALVGCYKGMNCGEGAEGVGRATTEAVVYSSISILIVNFFLTLVLGEAFQHHMIEVRDLRNAFGTHKILDGVNFRIERGESVVIIGRSGGGKSVLLAWGIVGTNYFQHDGCDEHPPYNHTRNFTSPFLNFFLFNNGFHTAHHNRPSLHWSLLPAYHEKEVRPHLHPNLNRESLLPYLWETHIYPGKRVDYFEEIQLYCHL